MKLKEVIEQRLAEDQKKEKERVRSGKWSPSSFGRCYRFQVWNRKDVEPSNPIDIKTLKKFRRGKVIHSDIQSLLDSNGVEVEITTEDCHGFVDYVDEAAVYDFKTCSSWQFKHKNKKGYIPEVQDRTYVLQLMYYAIQMNKPVGYICYVNEDYEVLQFEFKTEEWKDAVKDELEILNGYWGKDKLPPAQPRAYGGRECKYCKYLSLCEGECKREGVKHPTKGESNDNQEQGRNV